MGHCRHGIDHSIPVRSGDTGDRLFLDRRQSLQISIGVSGAHDQSGPEAAAAFGKHPDNMRELQRCHQQVTLAYA